MIVGITGAVGAGKSTLAQTYAARGFAVLDVDEVAAETVRALGRSPREVLIELLTGGPQRAALEAVLVPEVKRRIAAWCATTPGDKVIDSALLFEHGLDALCDETICVTCPREERLRRVLARGTTSAAFFDAIERAQWPEAEKAARATRLVASK
ncbi:MAG: dephospho-CoA kinase [Myxococcota bacterium]